jgi:hypothetical protein
VISKRSVGVLLGLIVVVALFTLFQDFRFDALLARERASALAVDRDLGSIVQSLSELRAAQAGYVATGQAPAAWMTRATEAFEKVTRSIDLRRAVAPNPDTRAKYDLAIQAIANLAAVDGRARASIAQEDRLHAADLIFIDAQQSTDAALAQLGWARTFEEQAAIQRLNRWAMVRLALNGLALVLITIIALYFGRASSILAAAPEPTMAQMLRELPPAVKGAGSAPVPQPLTAIVETPSPNAAIPRPVSLSAAAELCVDLARILDGRDVQALLERTAILLDAKGLMIWLVDTGGAILRPSMCHGYPDKVLSRLRPLQIDGDNVTSLAFRSMQAQTLSGNTPTDAGAIAVPLITATGCVGVLAAEIRPGKPHPDLLSVARIVAAQFATLVAPIDDAEHATARG